MDKGIYPVKLKNVKIDDEFWNRYSKLVREVVIPYQWKALNDEVEDAEPSHAIKNFKIAAGLEEGEYGGYVFQDTDVAKWLEAVAYNLAVNPDPELEKKADEVIDLIEKAQQKDGYLVTYFIIKKPEDRFKNLTDCHELYSAGHMIEAAVAYYYATGKRKLLDVVCKFADLIDNTLGLGEGKKPGYPGHEEIELALVKLYRATGKERYLKLSEYMINQRGQEPNYFVQEWESRGRTAFWSNGRYSHLDLKYHQAHKPVREQKEAVGHAVRAMYLYSGMADVAKETGDETLVEACKTLWNNVVKKQMYITGAVGSQDSGEAFSFDYHLPNATNYGETCASIGLAFFAHRMLMLEPKSEYADILEKTLYNGIISGMSLDGQHFFYVNPLEVWPKACKNAVDNMHVATVRRKWFGCACCPPNLARIISSLGEYIYSKSEDTVYTHLYIGSEANIDLASGTLVLSQKTKYPWEGSVRFDIEGAPHEGFTLAFRIPGWAKKYSIKLNGREITPEIAGGYAMIKKEWVSGDSVEIEFDMPVELVRAHPELRECAGKVAIMRGPIVYCLEEVDNGENLWAIEISENSRFEARFDESLLGGIYVVEGDAVRKTPKGWEDKLYSSEGYVKENIKIKAIPYSMWANRGENEMLVWIVCR